MWIGRTPSDINTWPGVQQLSTFVFRNLSWRFHSKPCMSNRYDLLIISLSQSWIRQEHVPQFNIGPKLCKFQIKLAVFFHIPLRDTLIVGTDFPLPRNAFWTHSSCRLDLDPSLSTDFCWPSIVLFRSCSSSGGEMHCEIYWTPFLLIRRGTLLYRNFSSSESFNRCSTCMWSIVCRIMESWFHRPPYYTGLLSFQYSCLIYSDLIPRDRSSRVDFRRSRGHFDTDHGEYAPFDQKA